MITCVTPVLTVTKTTIAPQDPIRALTTSTLTDHGCLASLTKLLANCSDYHFYDFCNENSQPACCLSYIKQLEQENVQKQRCQQVIFLLQYCLYVKGKFNNLILKCNVINIDSMDRYNIFQVSLYVNPYENRVSFF